ncbi:MAG: hypothetical protein LBD21_03340 [Tannerellaceae bacterium]|jgi:hypothetical protein|nr:hypothetical protein [Tannerellaceae bacterium]
MNSHQTDEQLKRLLKRLPEPELPASFRENIMHRILAEAERSKKRSERIGWLLVSLASLSFVGLGAAALIRINRISPAEFDMLALSLPSMPFYLYIGALALVLLGMDHIFVKAYRKKMKH